MHTVLGFSETSPSKIRRYVIMSQVRRRCRDKLEEKEQENTTLKEEINKLKDELKVKLPPQRPLHKTYDWSIKNERLAGTTS